VPQALNLVQALLAMCGGRAHIRGMFGFDNSYLRELPGTYVRQVPEVPPAPKLLRLNAGLARLLGLDPEALQAGAAAWFSGAAVPPGAEPLAQAYAGHQFGGFSPQLGDGRALLLGEITGVDGVRRDIALKGSGATPFSRRGDGKAALGPVLREYLMGEAMHALGIPTTRALAAVATGETVWRGTALPGAVLARVAQSHIRIGTFEFFAARQDFAQVGRLLAYTLRRHYPDLAEPSALAFLDAMVGRQARLVAQWMGVGFIHGVMNTDNMAASGETIDYGPCAFMEVYRPGTVFSSIDQQGRYAYANQPLILGWNMARLAEALLPLIEPDADTAVARAMAVLEGIAPRYRAEWVAVMRGKLGLAGEAAGDGDLADGFLAVIEGQADWTLAFRSLAAAAVGREGALRSLLPDPARLEAWLPRWRARLAPDAPARLRAANPAVIPRNHKVEEALAAAHAGDLAPFDALLSAVSDPFGPEAGREAFTLPAADGNPGYRTYCGT
jgi:uncharacterized protein YdiU (UPF0061 family)